jgi:BirA family biotin operon repressor/biotin-[acetyl-CoA-carboxylase] ligase
MFSLLLRPPVPPAALGWLPLAAGVGLVDGVAAMLGIDPDAPGGSGGSGTERPLALKWPNDLLAGGRKLAGVLAEAVPARPSNGGDGGDGPPPLAVVVGVGLNVTTRADELPPGATSLALAFPDEPPPDRSELVAALLGSLMRVYRGWLAEPAALAGIYRRRCATLGRDVRLELPGGRSVTGRAEDVDELGRIVVGGRPYEAGDVVHLRVAGG